VLQHLSFFLSRRSFDLQDRVLIRLRDYDQCFQSVQLLQWNSQVKFNVTVYRNLPTSRDSIMTIPLQQLNGLETRSEERFSRNAEIGRAVQQECRDRSRM